MPPFLFDTAVAGSIASEEAIGIILAAAIVATVIGLLIAVILYKARPEPKLDTSEIKPKTNVMKLLLVAILVAIIFNFLRVFGISLIQFPSWFYVIILIFVGIIFVYLVRQMRKKWKPSQRT